MTATASRSRMSSPDLKSDWIINPAADLSCISVGWLIFFAVPYILPGSTETLQFIAVSTFAAHRYITFPLVYLNKLEFSRRPGVYILTPIIALVGVGLCYYYRVDEPEMFTLWYLFTVFHIVRQKYGILRIYSGKAGWGHKRLDAWTVYLWCLAGFFYLLGNPTERGRVMHYLQTVLGGALPTGMLADVLYAAAIVSTALWLFNEFRGGRIHGPKLLFFASVVFLFGVTPLLSVDSMAPSSSFSHAVEYFAMVGLMLKNKARDGALDSRILSGMARRATLSIFLFVVAANLLFGGVKLLSVLAFQVIAYGASFTHYIYDGMIWRIRRRRVSQDVGIAPAAYAQPAVG
jgi:hypothetical protein